MLQTSLDANVDKNKIHNEIKDISLNDSST